MPEGSELPLDHHATTSQRGYPFLLGESGGVNYGHETLHDAKIVMDDLGQGTKQLVLQETLLIVWRELPYFCSSPLYMGYRKKGKAPFK